ncbi:hypothetical protein HMPREF1990_01410 [Porphyromonas gingivalis W4087]|uniref:Uncharacterized protein n=1 Tax=Porphyromonas gingivalis F0570 TaxID=1227271 RepID=A0A0E2LNX3_PORGN|nr:hypothetical protein HMPREF1555_01639 [Porphyromonas gingivalis F0570]ERJ82089.1 hypothetical protein HMPREF1989_02177 [Porphyromonas gingivalis F0566]ERJ88272.1 hypothetical protein HMPREF1990_01410 [Porphyromonas gingivalis W4087]
MGCSLSCCFILPVFYYTKIKDIYLYRFTPLGTFLKQKKEDAQSNEHPLH